jgi:hypothetical protein
MAVTGTEIATEARNRLSAPAGVRWTDAEVLAAINEGQTQAVALQPQANPVMTKAVMATSDTRQTFASLGITNGIQFIRALRNWSADGTTVGRAVTKAPFSALETHNPTLHSETGTEVEHYDTSPFEPGVLYIYPKVAANKRLEVVYSAVPTALGSLAGNIGIADHYKPALVLYVMYYLLSKRVQGSQASNAQAAAYYQQFAQLLGAQGQVNASTDQAMTAKGAEG